MPLGGTMNGSALRDLRDRWWMREETWKSLARRDHLWRAVEDVLDNRPLLFQLLELINSCDFIADKNTRPVKTLLWTAWHLKDLQKLSNLSLEHFTSIARALVTCSVFNHDRNGEFQAMVGDVHFEWARDCLRGFIKESVTSAVMVPVALVGTDKLAFLSLEVLNEGAHQIQHPCDELFAERDQSFRDSMSKAWRAACRYLKVGDERQGRWRLLDETGATIPEVIGDSAGGAATFGWLAAIQNQAYDPAVIVLGAIGNMPQDGIPPLKSVNGVGEKLSSILAHRMIDTIVTTSELRSVIREHLEQRGFASEELRLAGGESVLTFSKAAQQLRIRFR
jgi:hypothetical protein